jgi:hypothetical protein
MRMKNDTSGLSMSVLAGERVRRTNVFPLLVQTEIESAWVL